MKYSKLFGKTSKSVPHDADSANAKFLVQAGFIHQEIAGVYTFLTLGLRTLRKIENIVREEMENVGGQEILMPALTPKMAYQKTGRWEDFDVLFKLEGSGGKEYALGATHEEIVTPLVQDYIFSYKDLPFSVFQIQNKFRNEPRAKSGVLRGREFAMKDLYSFHSNQEDLDSYYEEVKAAYLTIFKRLGFSSEITYVTYASGGAFSEFSHEIQITSPVGEDTIYVCKKCHVAINKEIIEKQSSCPACDSSSLQEERGIEVGNIFKLGTRFSDSFGFKFTTSEGSNSAPLMGCYGVGTSRIMGTLVEVFNDERGMIWPKNIAPYQVHLLGLGKDEVVKEACEKLYETLKTAGIEVLYDDRNKQAGAKLADADLIGLPVRLLISNRTLESNAVEWKERSEAEAEAEAEAESVELSAVFDKVKAYYA